MRNSDLYITCASDPISVIITTLRWKLFGHILRLPSDIPANRYMLAYFTLSANKVYQAYKGGTIHLPKQLNDDLKNYGPGKDNGFPHKLTNLNDFISLRTYASNRDNWKTLVYHISTNYQQAVQQEIYQSEEKLTIDPSTDQIPRPRSRRRRRNHHQHGEDIGAYADNISSTYDIYQIRMSIYVTRFWQIVLSNLRCRWY